MLFLHWRSRDVPVLDAPTFTGNLINGQTLTAGALSADLPYVQTQYKWKAAASPYTTYADISGATSSTNLLTGDEIGDRIILSVRVRGADGWSEWTDSAPSTIVQDSPALPLAITGTPVTSALQGSPYSFTVTALNGTPGVSPKYTFALVGSWPPGISITPNAAGDQATISGTPTIAGTYGGLSVSVSDSIFTTVNVATFAINVSAAGIYPKLVPGSGWTGGTAAPAARGSAANVGYPYQCNLWWANEQYETITGQKVLELVAGHTGTLADWQADGTPLFGMYSVEASVDDGPWRLISPSYDAVSNRYGYRFIIDAADFADGVWSSTRREVRVRAVGKNGQGRVLQGDDFNWPGYRFSTNAGSGLTTTIKYCAANGNDTTGDGSSGNPYRQPGKAAQVIGAGGGIIKLKSGSYTLGGVSSFTDNGRWLTIQADDGLSRSEVTINATSTWVVQRTKLKSLTTTKVVPMPINGALCFDNCVCDQGAANVRVLDNAPYNYSGANKRVYFVDSYITNWAYGGDGVSLYRNCQIGTIASDVFRSTRCALNCSVNTILAGQRESSAGVWDGGGNYHPDFMQPYRNGGSYHWGGMMYNITATTGNANTQGPFFKDATEHIGFFMINMDLVLKPDLSKGYSPPNVERNAIYLQNVETMRNSMFYECTFTNGIRAWSGACDDVVAINLELINMLSNANSVPSQMLNYTP